MIQKDINLRNGKTATLIFNHFAPQTNASVFARCGNTAVLATVVAGKLDESKDYFPLQVDFIDKLYAGGQVKGGKWSKRDVGGTDEQILSSRIIDRSIRPLFPAGFAQEVQVITTLMSNDGQTDVVTLAFLAASAAISVSDIPFNGPVSAVRIGRSGTDLVVNPSQTELAASDLDLLVCTGPKGVNMIEAEAKILDNDIMYAAIELAKNTSDLINTDLATIEKEIGKEKMSFVSTLPSDKLLSEVETRLAKNIQEFLSAGADGAHVAGEEKLFEAARELFAEDITSGTYSQNQVIAALSNVLEKHFRLQTLSGKRYDHRALDEIRPLTINAGILPMAHGSALFQRGLTQAITNVSLTTLEEKLFLQDSLGETSKHYLHFYSAMPFSTAQVGRLGRPGRREVGHGALAEKALRPVVPAESVFPYTIVVTSEILSQNGSSSMASTCGSTMALLDAGVPLKAMVAGISTGMVSDGDDNFVLLTDIAGIEDHFGDMDFKITGTRTGITAIQLDIKREGLTLPMIKQTLSRSFDARQKVLSAMEAVLSAPRPHLSAFAPKIKQLTLPEDKIGEVIGPGGKNIKSLMKKYGVDIDIDDAGIASISSTDENAVNTAFNAISNAVRVVQIGESFTGTVTRVENYGAFVEFLPGREALLHVSEMATGFLQDVNSIAKVGDTIKVTVSGFNDEGKIKLSAPEYKASHKGDERPTSAPRTSSYTPRPMGSRPQFGAPRPAYRPSVNTHPDAPHRNPTPTTSGPQFANFKPHVTGPVRKPLIRKPQNELSSEPRK